eukprot:COSAG02_NODE_31396_length_534_cov_0.901149_1_plen_31_part_10
MIVPPNSFFNDTITTVLYTIFNSFTLIGALS